MRLRPSLSVHQIYPTVQYPKYPSSSASRLAIASRLQPQPAGGRVTSGFGLGQRAGTTSTFSGHHPTTTSTSSQYTGARSPRTSTVTAASGRTKLPSPSPSSGRYRYREERPVIVPRVASSPSAKTYYNTTNQKFREGGSYNPTSTSPRFFKFEGIFFGRGTPVEAMGAPLKANAAPIDTTERLRQLRELMKQFGDLDAYVVPSEDAHSSEYLSDCDKRREFISGFSGSAGTAVITRDSANLFTDGRYFLQASKQLDSNWTLQKFGQPGVPTWQEFLSKNLPGGSRIGVDATLMSANDAKDIKSSLPPKSNLVLLSENLVDRVWSSTRPERPKNKIFPLAIDFAGEESGKKISDLRNRFAGKGNGGSGGGGAAGFVVSMLDEVAWLFNLRGSDIPYNPVFFAYALITEDQAILFVDEEKVDQQVRDHLGKDVVIRPYDEVFETVAKLGQKLKAEGSKKISIGKKTNVALAESIGEDQVAIVNSFVDEAKSIKNERELDGFRKSHIRDGAALVAYFAWLEEQLLSGTELNEYAAAEKLEEYRSKQKHFQGLSFNTISSTGPNAAIIHYSPHPEDCAIIDKDQVYLCDSGGQYSDGTTDVTRTLHFGTPTDEEKRAFTRVLQGHIAIDSAVFPNDTTGYLLDAFARRALWQDGLDFRHGTGHGIGFFLNVHEGPHGIGTRKSCNEFGLKSGMTVSNEPGYYEDGKFGIRIENVVLVQPASTPNNFGDKGYLKMERVTMCPIQTKLVDLALLSPSEKQWLNEYHTEVLEKVGPLLKDAGDVRALKWLERECRHV